MDISVVFTRLRNAVVAIEDVPRVPARSQSPSLIVNVLFIDIVGYSKLPMEGQARASRDLTAIVSAAPTVTEFESQGLLTFLDTGDGMALVFEGDPTAPAYAALEIANVRGHYPRQLIRMGLHCGPATRALDINGKQNFKGVGINVAQRVMDCADGGQIMMTEHYANVLGSYEGWEMLIQDRGPRTVKHGLKIRTSELLHMHAPKHTARVHKQRWAQMIEITRWTLLLAALTLAVIGIVGRPIVNQPAHEAPPYKGDPDAFKPTPPKVMPRDIG